MATVKIPKQLFVVSKLQEEWEWIPPDYTRNIISTYNFGFLHPHEPTKSTDAKRKHTQMSWAYRGEQYLRGNIWWAKGGDSKWLSDEKRWEFTPYDNQIDLLYAPRVWDNEPLEGFKIIDTVNRYRGNKLFKVMDPRGLIFEVTVKSLFAIISEGTIEQGVIKEACVWKSNKDLVIAK
jgi:hypothetical protein